MAREIELPDGTIAEFPDGMSDSAIQSVLSKQFKPTAAPPAPPTTRTTGQYLKETLSNVPSSGVNLVGDLIHAVTNPLETVGNVADVAAGGLRKALPKSVSSFIDSMDPSANARQNQQRMDEKASAVGDVYANRYGGGQNILDTIRTDPVGAVGDLSAVFGGAGAGLKMVPGMGKAANVASKVSTAIDPTLAMMRGAKAGTDVAGKIGKNLFSTVTNIPLENIKQAYSSGRTGEKTFLEHLRGETPTTDTIDMVKGNIDTMRQKMRDNYANAKGGWANDTTQLNFTPIENAMANLKGSLQHNGQWKIGKDEQRIVREMEEVLVEWKADPSLHTVDGLDALKQRIQAIYPDSPAQRQAQRAVTTMGNEIKKAITQQSPQYAGAMKDYWQRAGQLDEIEKTLSLGDKATIDAAVRKLQNIKGPKNLRRSELVDELEAGGGTPIRPALAGQSMSEWTPKMRGLGGVGAGVLGGMIATGNPFLLGPIALSSPRLVGEGAHLAGKVAGSRLGRAYSAAEAQIPKAIRAGTIATPLDERRMTRFLEALRKEQ